ncbi:class I SAM-dependent methyltransferase [Maricaulis sp. CAU 1757]
MGFYADRILPCLIGSSCSISPIMRQRQRIVPQARGRVLEIGLGTGPNLEVYDRSRIERVIALEPSAGMRRKAGRLIAASGLEVDLVDAPAEHIPLEDDSVDTVVLTFTLCSIPDSQAALAEMRRVLKPDGELLFCEHGLAPDAGVARWQRRLEPVWKRVAGGCHLTRPMDRLIREAGFDITRLDAEYVPGTPKIVAYDYLGSARIG